MNRMTTAEYRASMRGKRNRAQGLAFESSVENACNYYKIQGMAHIEKTPEPMRVIQVIDRNRGIFKAVFQKAAQPDYKGTMKGGRAVVFEAKYTETDRIDQNVITNEQWEALDLHEAMGAWCFVVVSLGLRHYRVPWSKWKTMKEDCGHKYMNAADLIPYELPFSQPQLVRFLDKTSGEASERPL